MAPKIPSNGVNGTNSSLEEPKTMPLAIELVSQGRDAWSKIPKSRFKQEAFYHPNSSRLSTIHVKGGYFLEEDVDAFDHSFFNMTAEVAASMDPQLRIQLEVTFEAFESGIELQLFLQPNSEKSLDHNTRRFRIYSTGEAGVWKEVSRGLVAIETEEPAQESQLLSSTIIDANTDWARDIQPEELYASLRKFGITHDPSSQNLLQIRAVTLDQVFQAAYTTLSQEAEEIVGTAVPQYIKFVRISAELSSKPGDRLAAFLQLQDHSRQGFEISLGVFCVSQDVNPTTIQAQKTFDTLVEQLKRPADADEKALGKDLVCATCYLIQDAVAQLSESDIKNFQSHHEKLYRWMKQQPTTWHPEAHNGYRPNLVLNPRRCLAEILRRDVAPLEVMLGCDLLNTFYKEMLHVKSSTDQLAQIAAAFSRENPRARILEIGGGTGGCTEPVLHALGGDGTQPARFE
ncbi:hypothetical protein F4808DRAFT_461110 [Astrocystis sublimbata]|nr:hypothetical protein F4808DRAFT_461110 [Astrocystis sublimbata]